MWKTVLKRNCFLSVKKKTWDRPCHVNISKHLRTYISPPKHDSEEEEEERKQPDKDWFLYLQMENRLCRLNIREFCERDSSKVVECETVHDYYQDTIPTSMKAIYVGTKIFMWGGLKRASYSKNLDVYSFDPTDPARGSSFRLCEGPISRLIQPEILLQHHRVFTIMEKIYVLVQIPPYARQLRDDEVSHFRVFDPVHQSWKQLPDPPFLSDPCSYMYDDHFCCGHKLFIKTRHGVLYIFDTREEKWEEAKNMLDNDDDDPFYKKCRAMVQLEDKIHYKKFRACTELEGFLIGVTSSTVIYLHEVVAYELDSYGIPKPESYQVLHNIDIGDRIFWLDPVDQIFLATCDGGRMLLVHSTSFFDETYVTEFQVSISKDLNGYPVISARFEAQEILHLEGRNSSLCSAFALCHHSS